MVHYNTTYKLNENLSRRYFSENSIYTPLELQKRGIQLLKIPKDSLADSVIANLIKLPEVLTVEKDVIHYGAGKMNFVPNDAKFHQQWNLKNDGTLNISPAKIGADIKMEQAWNIEKGNENVTVAIIDTGCQMQHPELINRLWKNDKEIPGNNIDDDKNGYIDDVYGWDFHNDDNDPSDDHGHGTNVAGVIGANSDNSIGFSGIDMRCKLMILKGLDQENAGRSSKIISAIYYAVNNGANVINLSLGGGHTEAYQAAIEHAIANNVTVVASMMNNNNSEINFPAGYPEVIAVGATNPDDTRSSPFFWSETSGSSYGEHISVVAPGNYIFSISNKLPDPYNRYWGGTSQAAPHVSGLASLLIAQNPNLTPQEIKQIIESSADDQVGNPNEDTPGFDIYYGHGRINALKALSSTLSTSDLEFLNSNKTTFHPNPASHFLNIDLGNTIKLPEELYIYTTNGQTVFQQRLRDRKNTIQFNLNQGIYFLQIGNETFKLVVKH